MSKTARFFTFAAGALFGAIFLGNRRRTTVNFIETREPANTDEVKTSETEKES